MSRLTAAILLAISPVLAHADNIVRVSAPIVPAAYLDADALVGAWTQVGAPRDCTAWAPLASSQPSGTTFTQNALCTIDQQRQVQDRKYKVSTKEYINVGLPRIEPRILTSQMVTQQAQGTAEAPAGGCVPMGTNATSGFWMETRNGAKLHHISILYKGLSVSQGSTPTSSSSSTIPETTSVKNGGYTYTRGTYSHQVYTTYNGSYYVTSSYYTACQK